MAKDEIGRITAFKLRIDGFNDVKLTDYTVVAEGKDRATKCSYQLYFLNAQTKEANWFGVFRHLPLDIKSRDTPRTRVSGFIMLVKVGGSSYYGLTGGVGHAHLKAAATIEPRFGIKLAEAILTTRELKGLAQKDTSGEINYIDRAFRGFYNPQGDVTNLRRVLQHIRGTLTKDNELHELIGSSIRAGDALTVSGRKSFQGMLVFLRSVERLWSTGTKKMRIPQLEHIDKKHHADFLEKLEKTLVETLCRYTADETDTLFVDNEEVGYLPDRVAEYILIYNRKPYSAHTYEDVFKQVRDLLVSLKECDRIEAYRKMSLELTFDDGYSYRKKLSFFICGDVVHNNDVFFINNELWYRAGDEYLSKLDEEIDNIEHILPEKLGLIEWDPNKFAGGQAEDEYNAANDRFLLMHRHLVRIEHERGGIEFCDLLKTDNGRVLVVHVKHACGAALRALFAQGFISAKLYAESDEFKSKVVSCGFDVGMESFRRAAVPALSAMARKQRREMRVIFAIFDEKKTHKVPKSASQTREFLSGTLTTFAKVDLLDRVYSIRGMGYDVAVTRIRPYP